MKELMQLILALPLSEFRIFLRIKKNMKPDDLICSILAFKAIDQDKIPSEVIQFADPLALAIRNFNDKLLNDWNSSHSSAAAKTKSMSEDDHLELIITQLREFNHENFPDLAKLKIKVEALIDTYTKIEDGYTTYALTTLLAAITFVCTENKSSIFSAWYDKKTPKEFTFENKDILDLYASLHHPEESRQINLLYRLELECQALNNIVDSFIEDYIFTVAVVLQNDISVEELLQTYPDFHDALALREVITMLQASLMTGKSASDRLILFDTICSDVHEKINMIGNHSTEQAVQNFKKNISLELSASMLPKLTLFFHSYSHAKQPAIQNASTQNLKI